MGAIIRRLTPDDAEVIAAVESAVYGEDNPALINGADFFRHEMLSTVDGSFSVGAFDMKTQHLLGYILCYLEWSEFLDDEIAYVSDFAVLPELRVTALRRLGYSLGPQLFEAVLEHLRRKNLPLEGEFRQAVRDLVIKHPGYYAGLGYRLAGERRLAGYLGGEDFYWLRLEPAA